MMNPFRPAIRIGRYCRDEIREISRQARYHSIAILSPFLILLLIGIGFRSEPKALRTIFVSGKNDAIATEIYRHAPKLDGQIALLGITNSLREAEEKLRNKEVDLVVRLPDNAAEIISENEQAVFTIVHNEIDPSQAELIRLKGEIYVDRLNHWLLDSAVQRGREELQADLNECIDMVHELRLSLERADPAAARELEGRLNTKFGDVARAVRSRIEALDVHPADPGVGEILTNITYIRGKVEAGLVPVTVKKSYAEDSYKAAQLEGELVVLSAQLGKLKAIDARLLLSPFSSKVQNIRQIQPVRYGFLGIGIVILFLQHMAVTFSALSLVRVFKAENQERILTLRPWELLVGKAMGHIIVCGAVATILMLIVAIVLRMSIPDNWMLWAPVIVALLLSSLAVGFVISALCNSEEQALQYCMLILIVSVFFSGLFLSLQMFKTPLSLLSWAIPATHGISLLRDAMLRGNPADPISLGILVLFSLLLFPAALRLLRLRIERVPSPFSDEQSPVRV